ncbi:enolase C-terminal domain-like protein [Aurantivibrio plasticivorans]
MFVKRVSIFQVNLPLRASFKHALIERNGSQSLFLRIDVSGESDCVGWGEALPRDYVSGETLVSSTAALLAWRPQLEGQAFDSFDALRAHCASFERAFPRERCALAALELALLDAWSRSTGEAICKFTGQLKKQSLQYSAVISDESPQQLERLFSLQAQLTPKDIKLKVGKDIARVKEQLAATRRFYPDATIRLDANGAWQSVAMRDVIDVIHQFSIDAIEQPFLTGAVSAQDLAALTTYRQQLHRDSQCLLVLDESICSVADAKALIDAEAVDIINIKISKIGGLLAALETHRIASEAGIICQLGANVGESSLITNAEQIFAACAGDLIYHEGAFGSLLLAEDVCSTPTMFDSNFSVNVEHFEHSLGWSIPVNQTVLKRFSR